MNRPLRRYLGAFRAALRMTLRGEQPPALRRPELLAWLQTLAERVDGVYAAAEQSRLDRARREAISLRLDGRATRLETALAGLRFNARQEYPSLLRSGTQHSLLAIQAGSLNDRYRVSRLLAAPELQDLPALRAALEQLQAHLEALPPG